MLTLLLLFLMTCLIAGSRITEYRRLDLKASSDFLNFELTIYTVQDGGEMIVEFESKVDIDQAIAMMCENKAQQTMEFLIEVRKTRPDVLDCPNRWKIKPSCFEPIYQASFDHMMNCPIVTAEELTVI